jgi:hypothetical protein
MSEQLSTTVEISTYFTAEQYSPYALTSVVNEVLRSCGIEKQLPPQMMYQYTSDKKRYIPTVVVEGRRYVTRDEAIAWTEKYVLKHLAA